MRMPPTARGRARAFTLVETVLVILILGVLAGVAVPLYASMTKEAESANVEHTAGTLRSTLNIESSKALTSGQTIAAHNPFDDLALKPNTYAGSFPDVDLTNCQPGQWAYQSGNSSNGNWAVICYRPKATLTTAFTWGGAQWLIYTVTPVTNAAGGTVGLVLVEYPPLHVW